MDVDRKTVRWPIVILVIAGLAWVESALHSNHYYRLTYAACANLPESPYCRDWQTVAVFRAVFVILLGVAAWIYNERRTTKRL
jgi:hypothetical protein